MQTMIIKYFFLHFEYIYILGRKELNLCSCVHPVVFKLVKRKVVGDTATIWYGVVQY